MKRNLALIAALILFVTAASEAQVKSPEPLKDGDFLAICGDSITEQKQYSVFIEDYLLMCQPAKVRTVQAGWGGETAEFFAHRMAADVLVFHPTIATTCYGMNDGGYNVLPNDRAAWYERSQKQVVEQFKAAGLRHIIVGSPGVVDSTTFRHTGVTPEVYNKTLGQLRDIAKKVAAEEGVGFADVFDPMMQVMQQAKAKRGKDYPVAGPDGVHPQANGHLVMAYAFLKALGVDGNIGTITLDLGGGENSASEGHKIVSSGQGSVEIESVRYPFCFYGDAGDPNSPKGILEFLPFNQELNRLILVVKGAAADRSYNLTWGQSTQTYTGAQLAKGINLAAEFLDNPFSRAFAKVDAAVRKQQAFETPLTKQILHDVPIFKNTLPEDAAAIDELAAKAIAKDKGLAEQSALALEPVRHVIKIEAEAGK